MMLTAGVGSTTLRQGRYSGGEDHTQEDRLGLDPDRDRRRRRTQLKEPSCPGYARGSGHVLAELGSHDSTAEGEENRLELADGHSIC